VKFSVLKQQFGPFQLYVVCLLALLLCAYLGFTLGHNTSQQENSHMQQLEQTTGNLHNENTRLISKVNVMSLELELAKSAATKTVIELERGLLREVALRKELAFYQQVMAPELNPVGLAIDGFAIEQTLSEGYYRFRLVLVQQEKVKNTLKGKVDITLHGSRDGQPTSYALASLMEQQSAVFNYNFKYFQMIEGEFQLPQHFLPEKVAIHTAIYKYKRKLGELDKSFDWVLSSSE
jgi:hypothetical protein